MQVYGRCFVLTRTGVIGRFVAALFLASVTAVCARIAFHLWYTPVPITFQVLGVILSGLLLGSRWGAISQIQYLILGAIGLPVFAGGMAGPAAFVGPSGGYLLGFVVGAYVSGLVFERLRDCTRAASWIAGVAGILGIYLLGASWLGIWLGCAMGRGMSGCFAGAWQLGVIPFIGIDLLKSVAASSLAFGGRSGRGLFEGLRNL